MFDNGLDRPSGELFSRASEIQIDRTTNTASIVWEFRPFPSIQAPIVGSARRLSNGNTVINFGTREGAVFGASGPIAIYEVSPTGTEWLVYVEGARWIYRSTPLFTIGGESEVLGNLAVN